MSFRLTSKHKRWISVIAIVLAAIFMCSWIGFASDGFQEKDISKWVVRDRNENNILKGTFEDYNAGDGITAKGKNDGTIVLDGTYKGADDFVVIPVESVPLDSGTYTLSGTDKGTNQTYYLRAQYNDASGAVAYAKADFNGTFTITSAQQVIITLVACKDVELNNIKVQPVLVAGNEIGDFYA